MKKLLSVFLAVLLTVSLLAPSFAAESLQNAPTVYIVGGNANAVNAAGETILPIDPPEGYLGQAVSDCLPDLARALLLGTDDARAAYKEKLLSWVAPVYEKAVMDENGDPYEELIPLTDYNYQTFVIPEVAPNRVSGGGYDLRAYDFYYDWRLDPFVNAERLSAYIEAILRGTGAEKVNLLGRCEGATIVMAYLAVYGHEKVNKIFFNTAASNGYLIASAIFSGEMKFSSKEINAFLNNNPNVSLDTLDLSALPAGEDLAVLLAAFLDASAAAPGIDLTARLLDRAYNDLLRDVIADLLLVSYGTFPAVWAMVDNAHFDAAVKYVFAGREAQYAGLIEKITRYHETVALQTEALLSACEADGIAVGTFTKYGYPAIPLSEESAMLADGHALASLVSFGATTAAHDGTLDEKYVNRRVSEGKGGYISPDRKVDASTCLFPDTSWFVGRLEHQNFPWMIDTLTQNFFTRENYTVHSDAAYPQFMLFDEAAYAFVPQTEENADQTCVGTEAGPSFMDSMDRITSSLANLLIRLIVFLREVIGGIVLHAKGQA